MIKFYILVSLLEIYVRTVYSQTSDKDTLSEIMILIFSPAVDNQKYNEQLLLLSRDPLGIDKRNISVLEIFPTGGLESDGSEMSDYRINKFRMECKVLKNEFRIILMDSEKSIILNLSEVIAVNKIFELIDSHIKKKGNKD
jgi:hypothetical protein